MPDRDLMPAHAIHYHLTGGPIEGGPLCVVVNAEDLHTLILVDEYASCTVQEVRDLDCAELRRKVLWKYENMLRQRGYLVICPSCHQEVQYTHRRWNGRQTVRACMQCHDGAAGEPLDGEA